MNYLTYDVETAENPISENEQPSRPSDSKGTTINAELTPISIASTARIGDDLKTDSFCIIENPNFLDEWLEDVYAKALQVRESNMYQLPNIPQRNEVVMLGFNNSKFDNQLILPYIAKSKSCKIMKNSFIGTISNSKQIKIVFRVNSKLMSKEEDDCDDDEDSEDSEDDEDSENNENGEDDEDDCGDNNDEEEERKQRNRNRKGKMERMPMMRQKKSRLSFGYWISPTSFRK
jgi:hypothetical protein